MDASRLRDTSLFDGLADAEIERCARRFDEVELLAGSSLVKEGDFSYRFFVVLDGEVDVRHGFEQVRRLGPGEFFGELGLLSGDRRTAKVVAHSRCRLATMMSWDFREMLDDHPVLAERVGAVAAERRAGDPVADDEHA